MPDTIRSLHIIFTLIAIGILVGLGWELVKIAVTWPWADSRIGGAAVVICALLLLVAWLI